VTDVRDKRLGQLWSWLDLAGTLVILAGLYAAAAAWRPAAWILVGAVAVIVGGHVTIAWVAYRRTMRRAWPRVAPIPFDDD
jgi:uncharacterized membrane protein HdeD (DUF308 family)